MDTALTDTRRRATLRGRESVARWRVEGASWVGWLYGISGAAVAVAGLVGGTGASVAAGAVGAASCAAMVYGIHRMRRGSRVAACAVVLVAALSAVLSWPPSLWDAAVLFVLANGAWGAFELAAVRRDAGGVPPAPEPRVRFGRAFS